MLLEEDSWLDRTLDLHKEGTLQEAIHHLAPKGLVTHRDKNVNYVAGLFRVTVMDTVYLRYRMGKELFNYLVHGLGGEVGTPLKTVFNVMER